MKQSQILQNYRSICGPFWSTRAAQSWIESRWDAHRVSNAGCEGIAQFAKSTWKDCIKHKWVQPTDKPTDIVPAIKAQHQYMLWLENILWGDRKLALAAYNFGIGNVKKVMMGQKELPIETQKYIYAVLAVTDLFNSELID